MSSLVNHLMFCLSNQCYSNKIFNAYSYNQGHRSTHQVILNICFIFNTQKDTSSLLSFVPHEYIYHILIM